MEFGRFLSNKHFDQNQHYEQCEPPQVCWCGGAKEVQDLVFLRSVIREEVEEALKRVLLPYLQSPNLPATSRLSPPQAESSAFRRLYLHIDDRFLPETLFTLNKIKYQIKSLEAELRDESGSRVEDGPESSARIRIVVLAGDFEAEGSDWTEEDFNRKLVQPRKDKGSLLKGKCEIFLRSGVASISDICFTDNSKRNGTVRLGVQVVKAPDGVVIKEAVSKAFIVKERRLLSDKKHETPAPEDELWRLKNIRKDGPVYERAKRENICTVKDFLQLYHTDAKKMQNILNVAETKWKEIVENAEACVLTSEFYSYYDDTIGVEILMNCVFDIISATFRGLTSQVYGSLDGQQRELVNRLRSIAYEKRAELKTYNPTDQILIQAGFASSSESSLPFITKMQHFGATAVQQGAPSLPASSYLPSPLLDPFGYHHGQLEISRSLPDDLELLCQSWPSPVPEEDNPSEAFINRTLTSKLRKVLFVAKAATMFMISIKQDQCVPKKKRKLQ